MSPFFECGPFNAHNGEGRTLFDEVSLALDDGQCVVISGPSGGGKSTLLRHATGLANGPEASRRLAGRYYEGGSLPEWRSRVTLAAQDAPMLGRSIFDNLRFPFEQRQGRDRAFSEDEARRLLSGVGLEGIPLDRSVRALSGGERHRVALVRGLLWDPPVLVADEPLSGLDPDNVEACFELLLAYGRRPGRLALCVIHEPGLHDRADRNFRLDGGRLEAR
jgi:putative ABC transport system ATP-binding protein